MNEKKNPADKNLNERLASLEARLGKSRAEDAERKRPEPANREGFGRAVKMSSEFISAVLVGALIGYAIDTFAGTKPWAMIFLLLLGFVAGVTNVLRASGQMADPYQTGWAEGRKSAENDKTDQKAADKVGVVLHNNIEK